MMIGVDGVPAPKLCANIAKLKARKFERYSSPAVLNARTWQIDS